jgi:hypothetical protein
MPLECTFNLRLEGTGIVRLIQLHVVNLPARVGELLPKVAHAGKHESQLLLVMANVTRLVHHLRQQHHVVRPVRGGK